MTDATEILLELLMIQEEEDVVLLDGLDEAIVGYGSLTGDTATRVIYSLPRILEILVERHGMTQEEAAEYAAYNILALGVENAPMIMEQ